MYKVSEWVRQHYYLIKPGIVFNNSLTAAAGFLFAGSMFAADWLTGVAVVAGSGLIIASACVINNIIDRKIDKKMERTKKRALVTGRLSVLDAGIFGVVLAVAGFGLLLFFTNLLTLAVGAIAYVWYIVIYGWAKRKTELSTLIGTVPGALPPVAGYTALSGQVDLAAVLLFVILVTWQMGHFYTIAIYRRKEYAKAKLPIITVARGVMPAITQSIIYVAAFLVASVILMISGYAGATYGVTMIAVGAFWLLKTIQLLPLKNRQLNFAARRVFGFSLIVNMVMCLAIAIGGYLP